MCGTAPITDPPAHANVLPRDRIRGEIDITSPEHIQSLQMLFIRNMRKSKIDDNMKEAYLELFKEVIMLDKNVHENERILYRLLCEQWDHKSDI